MIQPPMHEWIDTHAHLDDGRFAGDLPQVVERARAAGITRIITIGTDLARSQRAIELSEQFPGVYAAVGWQPLQALEAPEEVHPSLRPLTAHPRVVAIGEIGLDYYWLPSRHKQGTAADDAVHRRRQQEIFQQQLELAAELGLNCIIHQREALEDTLALIEPFVKRVRLVFHCFNEKVAVRERLGALGALVSYTGIVTFKNGQAVRETLAATPLEGFLLETDSPYMAPEPYRGRRCEPAYVREIAECAARVKGCSLAELSAATAATARGFFPKLFK